MLSASTATLRNRAASVLPGLATKLKARKHLAACLATGACALATTLPANAALTFDFSFDVTNGGPDVATGTVTGTISGLVDNTANQKNGLIVSNLSAPNTPPGGWPANLEALTFIGNGITVSNGNVVSYDIRFGSNPQFGEQYDLALEEAGLVFLDYLKFIPDNANFFNQGAEGTVVTFTSQSGPGPAQVPGPLPLLGAGAAFGWSRKLRRRVSASAFRL